jgi:ribonuclease R
MDFFREEAGGGCGTLHPLPLICPATAGSVPSLFMDIRQKVLNLLASPSYRPLRRHELAQALKLADNERTQFRRVLAELLRKGEVVRVRKERFVLPAEADLVAGRLEMNERGFGFVIPETDAAGNPTAPADIYIAADNVGVAMHGDRVVARLNRGSVRRDRRGKPQPEKLEGRIIRILERANDTLVGTLQKPKYFFIVIPDDPRIVNDIYVKPHPKAKVGDKVVVKLQPWESRHVNPEGDIVEVLGHGSAPGVDMLAIIRKHRLPQTFPTDVLRDVERMPENPTEEETRGRLDLRGQFIVTIDPDDARDHDDAVSVEARPDGSWRLGVHIADVSHYVRPKTALDREARARGNSIYLVDRVIPMLPEKLSAGLCSLFGHVDRLAKTVFIDYNAQGQPKRTEFYNSVIRVKHLITYREALERLNSPNDGNELTRNLKTTWRLASLLRKNRFQRGSLDLDFPEIKVRLDKLGKPIALEKIENDISHQLIEEFMLAANEAVARHFKESRVPGLYRIHENPDPEKLSDFRDFIAGFGIKVGDLTQRTEVQKLIEAMQKHPQEYVLKVSLLRSLKRAFYSHQPVGHYGLAKLNYTHFTSPIRRYPDLVVHRILDALTKRRPTGYLTEHLIDVAKHCSQTERTADEAENESKKLKTLEYFNNMLHNRRLAPFDALVSDVRNFGLFVELPEMMIFGLVHVSTIDDDFYAFDDVCRRLVGKRTRRTFKVGDRVKVLVSRVDLFKRQVDFQLAKSR